MRLRRVSPKKIANIPLSIRFITAYCKDFRSLRLKNEITFQNSSSVYPHQYIINHKVPVAELWGVRRVEMTLKGSKSRNFP